MKEPTRLRDAGADDVRDLLRAGSPTRAMTSADRARTGKRVAAIASGAVVLGTASLLPSIALGAGAAIAVVVGAWLVPSRAPDPAPAVAVTAPVLVAPPPAPSSAPPVEEPAPSATASAAPRAPAPASTKDALAEEAELLEEARAALASSPADALARSEAHAARFPRGKLGVERELLAVDALRRLGRVPEARARAERLLRRAEGSLYEERVRALLDRMK